MAQFKGTIKEFTKYIGAYARLKVTAVARNYKQNKNCCEECGANSSLEIAHVKGKERPVLIAQILSEFMDETDCIDIDLNEFEERFTEIHLPLARLLESYWNLLHANLRITLETFIYKLFARSSVLTV
jgi:hypothetical protein